jgi:hypothetical protein
MDRVTFRRSRQVAAYTLCALAVFGLAACGGGGGSASDSNDVVTSGTPPSSAAPTISGSPSTTVTAGQAYSFTPSAGGPSGTTLSFSIQNSPSWASFSIATGALTGTPSSSSVGTYANIVISVSDGTKSAALSPFSIQVASSGSSPPPTPPTASGSVTLSWTTPTTNTNGTALGDLAGYTINYGTSPGALSESITVSSATATGYTVSGLASGTWYFTVTAYTTAGTQSSASNVITTTI